MSPTLRRALLALVALGMLGVGAELILLEHWEEWQQWSPLAALGVGLVSVAVAAAHPGRVTLRTLQVVMAVFVFLGVAGIVLHYRGNAAFELEMDPGLVGAQLFWESVRGATPALAPSAMVYLGLLGMLATWRHPGLTPGPPDEGRDRAAALRRRSS